MTGAAHTGALSCSVVVPVKDDAQELRGLLAALDQQTVSPLEIIVVDNGSTDDSARVAGDAGCRVVHESTPGIAAAAAAGYDAARGDLILRCDADTRPGPTWVAAHRRAHESAVPQAPQAPADRPAARTSPSAPAHGRPQVVAVTGPARFRLPAPLDMLTSTLYLGGYVLAAGAALGHPPLFGTTMSLRRDWWQQVGGGASRSAEVHDDMDLSFRVLPHQTVRLSCEVAVDMSPRALAWGNLAQTRFRRAFATLSRAWAEQTPWDRWADRLASRGLRLRARDRGRPGSLVRSEHTG